MRLLNELGVPSAQGACQTLAARGMNARIWVIRQKQTTILKRYFGCWANEVLGLKHDSGCTPLNINERHGTGFSMRLKRD